MQYPGPTSEPAVNIDDHDDVAGQVLSEAEVTSLLQQVLSPQDNPQLNLMTSCQPATAAAERAMLAKLTAVSLDGSDKHDGDSTTSSPEQQEFLLNCQQFLAHSSSSPVSSCHRNLRVIRGYDVVLISSLLQL